MYTLRTLYLEDVAVGVTSVIYDFLLRIRFNLFFVGIDRRGLVVRVLYDPGTTSAADLRALEIGGLGCIFR